MPGVGFEHFWGHLMYFFQKIAVQWRVGKNISISKAISLTLGRGMVISRYFQIYAMYEIKSQTQKMEFLKKRTSRPSGGPPLSPKE